MPALAPTRSRQRPRSRVRVRAFGRGRGCGEKKTQIPRLSTGVSGRRYYCPSQGRFLGRDPKQKAGGINLYGFCRNNSINFWDYLGMAAAYMLEEQDICDGTWDDPDDGQEGLVDKWEKGMVWVPYEIGDDTDVTKNASDGSVLASVLALA